MALVTIQPLPDQHWRIVFAGTAAHTGCVFVNDKDITRSVEALEVKAPVGGVVRLTLHIIPSSLEIEGVGSIDQKMRTVETTTFGDVAQTFTPVVKA